MKNLLMIAAIAALFLILGNHAFAEKQPAGNIQAGQRGPVQDGRMQGRGAPGQQNRRPVDQNQQARGGRGQQGGLGQRGGQGDVQTLFAQFDQNGDGVIMPNEVPRNGRQRLAQMDTDGNGGCDMSELQAVLENQQQQRGPRQGGQGGNAAMFAQFDQNGDGVISPDEIPQNGRQRLAQMDTNGDGACDRSELESAMQNQQRQGQRPEGQQRGQGQQANRGQRGSGQFGGQQRTRGGGQARGGGGQARGGGGQARGGGGRGGNRR